MVNDPIGDMIARIKNAAERKRSKVSTPASKMRGRVLDVLQSEGYIRGYSLVEETGDTPVRDRAEVLRRRAVSSRKSPRVQAGPPRLLSSIKDLKPVRNGLGISILSTPKGVMSDAVARDQNVGGEVLCRVY